MVKKRPHKTSKPLSDVVLATPERQRQEGGVKADRSVDGNIVTTPIRRHRARFASVLDAYLWHGVITEDKADAGRKFYREYARSVLGICIEDHGSGSHGDAEMRAISAVNANSVLEAAFAVMTFAERDVVISVCVDNTYAGTSRRTIYLSKGLGRLAKLWNMSPTSVAEEARKEHP